MNAAFYDMLCDKVECNAGIHLYPITDGPYGPDEMPMVWLSIDADKTDPVYVGTVIGKAVWDWWYNNADDIDFPDANILLDYAMEHYWDSMYDRDGWLKEYFVTVYDAGNDVIKEGHGAYMREYLDSMYADDLFSDGELDALMREERDAVDSYDEFVNDL
jgi:hypothetical protein